MTDPTYSTILEKVWTWMDFFGHSELGGRDTGIDLVAKTRDGEYWAIQCKCYAEDHPVTKADMDTFLSTSGRRFHDEDGNDVTFSLRVIVATTDNWGSNALEVTKGQTIPVTIIGLSILENAPVDWDEIEAGVHGKDARKRIYDLRDHQREALEAALTHYKEHDRGKMIMACGTGKTFTSLRIAEALLKRDKPVDGKGCILFLAPSISLVGQTLREWMANSAETINPICVCSDPTVTKMKLIPAERKLVYNQYVTIEDIPEDAFRYVVNGRSALGWVVDQYQVSTDKESGIVNNPNEYAGPRYIFDLVRSIITVSVETMRIVDDLPRLDFGKEV